MRLENDQLLDGRYRIVDRVGSGGMADVYLAEDQHLGRKVAVKVLHERFAEDQEFIERFKREASAAAGLQHKNVVSVFDRGQVDGTYYIAMEYLQGRTLKDIIKAESPMATQRAIALSLQMLAAARFAHRRGIVHRDIKPQNMIVDDEGTLKITDFGIARAGTSEMTEAGAVLGTAHYISPEQAQGLEVGPPSDLYSIGIVMFEMLTGKVPFTGDTAVAIALKHVSEQPPASSSLAAGVPPALDAIVARALAKDPANRFRDAEEFANAVEGARDAAPTVAQQSTEVFSAPTVVAAPTRVSPVPVPVAIAQEPVYDIQDDRDRRNLWWALIALSALVIALLLYLLLPGLNNDKVAVPYVEGKSLEDARADLADVGLESRVVRKRDDAPANEVIAQDPARDTKVDEGTTVELTVSTGPGEVEVPRVRGLTEDRAVQRLKLAGFRVNIERANHKTIEDGFAIKTIPPAGEKAERRTSVDLFISKGPKKVQVPDVTGLDQSAAKKRLADAGFEVDTEQQDSSEPEGTVVEQSPVAGTEADDGSTVTIVVSTGEVEVPDVVGMDEDSARQELRDQGFKVEVDNVATNDPDQDGKVSDQDPRTGKQPAGSTIVLTVEIFDPSAAPPE